MGEYMDDVEKIIAARKKAEEAISEMPEGDIKTKAFETILTHLLSNPGALRKADNPVLPPSKRKTPGLLKGNTPEEATDISSSDLAALKSEIQDTEKIKSPEALLLIAELYDRKGQSTFSTIDLEKVYRALVRGGASKLPLIKNYRTLAQDMVRYKFWFDRAGRGRFQISDAGVRALQELRKNSTLRGG